MTDVIHCLDSNPMAAWQHSLLFEVALDHVLSELLLEVLPFSALPTKEDFILSVLLTVLPLLVLLAVLSLPWLLDV